MYRLNRFDRIPACDRQTGGQTDILRQFRNDVTIIYLLDKALSVLE